MIKPPPTRHRLLGLSALFALGLGLRLWGAGFGLPYPYHPDEPAHVLQALAVARGLPEGLTFANPPLYKYLLLAEYVATYAVGRLAGAYTSPQDFIAQFRADPTLLYLIGRATSAVLGALTVLATYALATALRGHRAGLVAGYLTAVAYLLVRESHFAVNDALVTLLVTVALFFCVRVTCHAGRRDYLAAGLAIGLAFAAKYHGAVALVPLALAHALDPRRRLSDLLLGLGAAIAATLIAFPSIALETGRVVQDIYLRLYTPGQIGYDGLDPAGGYVYYLKVLNWGLGWPLVVAAGAGLVLALVRRDRPWLVVASLPVALYVIMGFERMYFARFLLPALPAVIVLAAVAVDSLAQSPALGRLGVRRPTGRDEQMRLGPLKGDPFWPAGRSLRLILPVAVILLGLPSLIDALRFDLILTRTDTRTEAKAWIEGNLPPGTRLAVDAFPFGPPLSPDRYDLLVANGWPLYDLPIGEYRQRGVAYLVASSYTTEPRLLDPAAEARRRAFYAALAEGTEPAAEFRPHSGHAGPAFVYDQIYAPFTDLDRLERPGPTITVYPLAPDGVGE